MRRVFDPNSGADVTSTVQGYLTSGRTFVMANLFRIQLMDFVANNPNGNYASLCYTDADFPIFVNKAQRGWLPGYQPNVEQLGTYTGGNLNANGLTFLPDTIQRSKLTYGIGFQASPLELVWAIDETKNYGYYLGSPPALTTFNQATYPPNLTMKQAFLMEAFDRCPFWLYRAIFYPDFPTKGGSFVGTTLMFRGYIRNAVGSKESLRLTVDSLMQVFQDTQVPTQTIQPNSRSPWYVPNPEPAFGGDFNSASPTGPTSFTVATAENVTAGALTDCWVTFCPNAGVFSGFTPGYPVPPVWRIRYNTAASGGSVTIYTYKPYIMGNGTYVNVLGQAALNAGVPGFPYVPKPEASVPQIGNAPASQNPPPAGGGSS